MKLKQVLTVAALAPIAIGAFSLTGCESSEPCVGTWYLEGGYEGKDDDNDVILKLDWDRTGYYLELDSTLEYGNEVEAYNTNTWKRTEKNSYIITENGKEYEFSYDEESGTLIGPEGGVFSKMDPVAGYWTGDKNPTNGSPAFLTVLFKNDGLGETSVVNTDGTVEIGTFEWKNNKDGVYTLDFGEDLDGVVWVMNAAKDTVTSSTGNTLRRIEPTVEDFVMVGPWYCEDAEKIIIFNVDGTGSLYNDYGPVEFTWKLSDEGKVTITGTSGIDSDGNNANGKVIVMTHDKDSGQLISPDGQYVFEHVKDDIDGFVTKFN